jgi:hypothetical protein
MSTSTVSLPTIAGATQVRTRDLERWILPTILLASTCIVLGTVWDISWHMTIGRDTLWSPPHLLEQFGAALAGATCGAYVLWLTFRAPVEARARTVRFWGFYGPLGAWACIWGAFAMIASVPFDDWWHNAYGLDVQILSPPHSVLIVGVLGIQLGTILFALAAQNRAQEGESRGAALAFLYAGGVLILMATIGGYEYIAYPNEWHRSGFYVSTALVFPILLLAVARAARVRWPATSAAAIYMAVMLFTMYVLQLVPAEPRLAPIYNRVDHMVPLTFPLVLIAPAFVIDFIMRRMRSLNDWQLAMYAGSAFVLVMLVVHWPFGEFMLSPSARNYIFAADQWPYMNRPGAWRQEFWMLDQNAAGNWSAEKFIGGIGRAVFYAFISARIGLWWGNWMQRVRR